MLPRLSGSGFNVPGWKTPNHIWSKIFCLYRFHNAFSPVTQFISHRLCRWEFKRFYRYREGMLDECKSDRCRRLMNWDKIFLHIFYNLLVCAGRPTTTQAGWGKQNTCQWWLGQVVIKTNRSDKTEVKKNLKISVPQQRWPRPLPGAILIPPAGGRWFNLKLTGRLQQLLNHSAIIILRK